MLPVRPPAWFIWAVGVLAALAVTTSTLVAPQPVAPPPQPVASQPVPPQPVAPPPPVTARAPAIAFPPIVDDYQFAAGFSDVQGQNQWRYLQWRAGQYSELRWEAPLNRWRGDCTYCIISRGSLHPDVGTDAVIAWEAPRPGTVAVQGMMDHRQAFQGDGVQTSIIKRSGATLGRVWPSSPRQDIRPNFMVRHVAKVEVGAGDLLYFHVHSKGTSAYDGLAWTPRVTYDLEPEYTLDGADLVMRPADYERVGIRNAQDSSLSIVPNGKNVDFYHSDSGRALSKFRGPLDRPAQARVYVGGNAQRLKAGDNEAGNWWISNLYRTPEGHLLAFCHIENGDTKRTGWWSLGLAYSKDNGNSFRKLGRTVAATDRNNLDANIGGVPYVIKDGYFYAYFSQGGVAVARAPVAEVLDAARKGTVTPWTKYHNGTWSGAGIHGPATPVVRSEAGLSSHGDAAYSTYLGRYLLSSYTHDGGKGVFVAFADDPASYGEPSWIQRSDVAKDTLSPYQTIVNVDGSDNGVVGQTFYVYSSYRFSWGRNPEPDMANQWRWLYRQKVTLNRAAFANDGKLFRQSDGTIAVLVGGSPAAFGTPAEVHASGYRDAAIAVPEGWFATLPGQPQDRALLADEEGSRYVTAGGAKIWFGTPAEISATGYRLESAIRVPSRYLDQLGNTPRDQTLVRAENGSVFVIAGGAPMWFATAAEFSASGYHPNRIVNLPSRYLDGLDATPRDGTLVRTASSPQVWRLAGGARSADTPPPGATVTVIGDTILNTIPLA